MTYRPNVFGVTLNLSQSVNQSTASEDCQVVCPVSLRFLQSLFGFRG